MAHVSASVEGSGAEVAFVAGATGYTGREVVRVLREKGIRTIAHVRPDSSRLDEWKQRFAAMGAEVDATPWEAAALNQTFGTLKPTLVFGLLGTTRARGKQGSGSQVADTYDAVDYGLTKMAIDASLTLAPLPRFIYLSSLGADSAGGNAYLQARARVEQVLREGRLPYIIARPSFITGEDRDEVRPGEQYGAVVANAVLGVLGKLGATTLRDRYASLTGNQLARGLVTAALDPQRVNQVLLTEALRTVGQH